jgi:hypothetical protein
MLIKQASVYPVLNWEESDKLRDKKNETKPNTLENKIYYSPSLNILQKKSECM